jgi:hypothetical protein
MGFQRPGVIGNRGKVLASLNRSKAAKAVNDYFLHSNPWFMLSTGPLAPDRLPRICVFLVGSVAHYKYAIDQDVLDAF